MFRAGPEWQKSGLHMVLIQFEVEGVHICGAGLDWQKRRVHLGLIYI